MLHQKRAGKHHENHRRHRCHHQPKLEMDLSRQVINHCRRHRRKHYQDDHRHYLIAQDWQREGNYLLGHISDRRHYQLQKNKGGLLEKQRLSLIHI